MQEELNQNKHNHKIKKKKAKKTEIPQTIKIPHKTHLKKKFKK